MPFDTKIETAAGILGIWELRETPSELEEFFRFSENERSEYLRIKFNRRKTEFLSTRLLTEVLVGKKVEIEYLPTGKPRIKNESMFISISHSENFVAVLISKNHRVGIDIERTDRNIGIASKRYLCGEGNRRYQETRKPTNGENYLLVCKRKYIQMHPSGQDCFWQPD